MKDRREGSKLHDAPNVCTVKYSRAPCSGRVTPANMALDWLVNAAATTSQSLVSVPCASTAPASKETDESDRGRNQKNTDTKNSNEVL